MQTCNILVSLGGDLRHQVFKRDATVPEIVVLEHLHGVNSVQILSVTGMDKRPHGEELARLRAEYSPTNLTDQKNVVGQLFPGHSPQLPVKLKDIGKENPNMDDDDEEGVTDADKERAASGKKKKTSKKKAAKKRVAAKAESESEEGEEAEDDGLLT